MNYLIQNSRKYQLTFNLTLQKSNNFFEVFLKLFETVDFLLKSLIVVLTQYLSRWKISPEL